jgi:hypothetical protein
LTINRFLQKFPLCAKKNTRVVKKILPHCQLWIVLLTELAHQTITAEGMILIELTHLHVNTIRQKDLNNYATAIIERHFYGTIHVFIIEIQYVILSVVEKE